MSKYDKNKRRCATRAIEKGAVKSIANIPSDLGKMLMKGSALQAAGEMEQAAAMQGVFGQTQSAAELSQGAQEVRASANSIDLPKFKMSNAALAGGDKIDSENVISLL
ncbi:hypothetical protein [Paraburkholderia bannensis]|uniref:hypothetical protein n=1 Tax=Paraburkholderia bannensis TaxID=765414 RepID=UPI001FDF807B|nr:hypothetical protein [Paraburkholderia bannensis]